MSPKSLYQQWRSRGRDRGAKDSKPIEEEQGAMGKEGIVASGASSTADGQMQSFKREDGMAKAGTVASAASSTPHSQMQSEHREDDSKTIVASRNLSKDGRSDTAQSLWDRAYGALKTESPQLVKKYEKLLSRELEKTNPNPEISKGDPPDQGKRESLDETDNQIDNANLRERRAQLDLIIEAGLEQMDKKKIKYTIAGHEFDLQDQIAQAAGLVQGVKDFVGEAVKASPEASLTWAGVCVILPLLTNPSAAEQANRDGFTYVTSRMRYYVALEPLLWPDNQDLTVTDLMNLRKAFEAHIIDLYQHILDFQFRSVLRFYRSWRGNLGRDVIQHDDWKGMLTKVQELEKTVDTESARINRFASREVLKGLSEKASGSLEAMQKLLSVVEQQLQVQKEQLQAEKEIVKNTHEILTKIPDADQAAIDLPTVENAPYDSKADEHIPVRQPGTRVGILNRITTWANDVEGETIFWLYGPAGTGKSTISRTFAQSLADTRQLGASYFFKKGEEGRNDTARFFPTIASQLVNTILPFKTCLRKSLQKLGNAKVEKKSLGEQFKTLILTPLSEILPHASGILTRVVVIDALDECECYDDVPIICRLLSQLQELSTVRLRIFLTSRSANPIVDAFEDLRNNNATYRSLALNEEFYEETKADISAFLKEQFTIIKAKKKITKDPWPDPEDLVRLVTLASQPSPLFIYAASLCRFVDDETGRKRPTKQLELWLKECDSNASQLNQIYIPILRQVLLGTDKEGEKADALGSEDRSQLLQILSSIVLLRTPLPAQGLAALLSIDEDDVKHWLRNLHAVLDIRSDPNAPVRLLHKSFSDFLLGHEGIGMASFRVNVIETHAMLASKCIKRMKSGNGLRRDICNVQNPGKLRDEIDEATVARHIPPDLQYACLYWVYHLQHSGRHITDEEEVYIFLRTHFLHWLESLSLLRKLSDGIPLIRELLKTIKSTSDTSLQFARFLKDAEKFVLSYGLIMEQAPLQTYGAALAFCPTKSEVKQKYWGQRLPFIRNIKGIKHDWDSSLQVLEGHRSYVTAVAFSPDGNILASASDDNTVRFWDAATGAHRQTLEGHSRPVNAVAFSPDSKTLASASNDNTVRLWDAVTGAYRQRLEGHSGSVNAVAFSPGGNILASASNDNTVRLWDAVTGAHKQTLEGHSGWVRAVAFSSDGKMLASASQDNTGRLWDAVTGAYRQTLEGHSGSVNAVAFSPDGNILASASDDNTVRLWDAVIGAHRQTLEGHSESVNAIAFSPDGNILASASWDSTVRLWDAMAGAHKQTLEDHSDFIYAVAFSPDGKMLASASRDNTVRLWDAVTGAHRQTLEGHSGPVYAVAFSPDGNILASASRDDTGRLWDPTTSADKQTLEGHSGPVYAVAFSPDGKMLASASHDRTIQLWDAITGAYKETLMGHYSWVTSVAFSPDGKILASTSGDSRVVLWDPTTGAHRQTFEGHSRPVNAVAFSPDSKTLASASNDSTVRLWDAVTGAYRQTLEGHSGSVNAVAFSPDGNILASASDHTVRLWDAVTGAYRQTLEGHSSLVNAVAFSPDGNILASASWDNTVRLWDAVTGAYRQTIAVGTSLNNIAYDITGSHLATEIGGIVLDILSASNTPPAVHANQKPSRQGYGLSAQRVWATWNSENLLWLPLEYRPKCSVVAGSTVAIGCESGRVLMLNFSVDDSLVT